MKLGHSFKNGKWSDPNVPKWGWYCIDGYDRGRDNLEPCDMCETAAVRYVHVLRHKDYPDSLDVGCICAGRMEQDHAGAKRREADIRNRSARRSKWPHRSGWRVSANGNPTIKVKGRRVTVFRSGGFWKFLLVWHERAETVSGSDWDDQWIPWVEKKMFSSVSYETIDKAKLAAFDVMEERYEP